MMAQYSLFVKKLKHLSPYRDSGILNKRCIVLAAVRPAGEGMLLSLVRLLGSNSRKATLYYGFICQAQNI